MLEIDLKHGLPLNKGSYVYDSPCNVNVELLF